MDHPMEITIRPTVLFLAIFGGVLYTGPHVVKRREEHVF
jgi:hypothetical protein